MLFVPMQTILKQLRAMGLNPRNHYEAVKMYSAIGDGSVHAYPVEEVASRRHDCKLPRRKVILKGALLS